MLSLWALNRSNSILKVVITNKTVFKRRMLILVALLAITASQFSLTAHAAEHFSKEHPETTACLTCLALTKDEFDYELDDTELDETTIAQFAETRAVSKQLISFAATSFSFHQHDFRRARAPPCH